MYKRTTLTRGEKAAKSSRLDCMLYVLTLRRIVGNWERSGNLRTHKINHHDGIHQGETTVTRLGIQRFPRVPLLQAAVVRREGMKWGWHADGESTLSGVTYMAM